eukprot:TRINITY_DN1356_c0_g3_i1.p1 TRINITY_DN1356_c0_g3~~TRINITY_DN1356_c0_g3_i1.p1  ORF type:complete len:364 (+),score=74.25 TRINITY_DN1356_c0_g3_i1:103-1092(+)
MTILGLDTSTKKAIFLSYMGLWSALRLLTYGSKQDPDFKGYNETSLLLFVCIAKLCMAVAMFLRSDGGWKELVEGVKGNGGLFARYFLPAASYVVYDNLTFVNLTYTDPVTYVILMQMRLAVTGLMWSMMFGKRLNRNQWIAIAILTAACFLQKGPDIYSMNTNMLSLSLIGFQIIAGVFSSVFNEILLKEKGSAGVNLQNIFMYTHSIMCNFFWLLICPSSTVCKGNLATAMTYENLSTIFHPKVLPIGVILATIGIVTSLFIKHLDSVRKTIASAIEIFVDAFLSWLIFSIPLTQNTIGAVVLASSGVIVFSRPVVEKEEEKKEGEV